MNLGGWEVFLILAALAVPLVVFFAIMMIITLSKRKK